VAVDWGVVGTTVPAFVGGVLGVAAFVRQSRQDRTARLERAKAEQAAGVAQDAAHRLQERSRAFDEMAEALERLGDAVERADRRATECERREEELMRRLRALETVTGLSGPAPA
jgi:methyl-accepting chemotaxis protein